MFCTKCGAKLPEGAAFCTSCGSAQNARQTPPQQPAYQPQAQRPQAQYQPQPQVQRPQPVYQPQPQPQNEQQPQGVYRVMVVTKKEFLEKHAKGSAKTCGALATLTFALSLLLILASVLAPIALPFYNVPAVSVTLTLSEVNTDEMVWELQEGLDQLEREIRAGQMFVGVQEQEILEKVSDKVVKLRDNLSVLNLVVLLSTVQKETEAYMNQDELLEIEQAIIVSYIVIGIVVALYLLPLLFTILAGTKKSTGWTVTALIFTVLPQLPLCNPLFVVASLVIFITQAVLCSKVKKHYRAFLAASAVR